MGLIDNMKGDELGQFTRRQRVVETQAPVGFTSVSKGRLRVASTEGLVVEGSQKISGTSSVTGAQTVSGSQTVSGTETLTGTRNATGTHNQSGAFNLTGSMTVSGGGKITVGSLVIDPAVGAGGGAGRFVAPVGIGFSTPLVVVNNLAVLGGLEVDGAKNFRTAHPLKDGWWLRHGATESPVSGVEYWGEGVIEDDGTATVRLPDYFDALTKDAGRTVFVTGRGFAADWSDVDGDTFTVEGSPGKSFSWLVKAERIGGDFEAESLAEDGTLTPGVDDGGGDDEGEDG